MKNLLVLTVVVVMLTTTTKSHAQNFVRFIDNIELAPAPGKGYTEALPSVIYKKSLTDKVKQVKDVIAKAVSITEQCTQLQFKFALMLNREVESLTNVQLFSFIDEWWATKYRYGGTSKKGIDCSAFTGLLMSSVFAFKLPRTAREQYSIAEKIKKDDLIEGDLVFFNTTGGVSHVGYYLGEGYFVHASSSKGVTINNLDQSYFSHKFIGGGRFNKSAEDSVAEVNNDSIASVAHNN